MQSKLVSSDSYFAIESNYLKSKKSNSYFSLSFAHAFLKLLYSSIKINLSKL